MNKNSLRKLIILSSIVAIAIFAGVLAGCQKEREDEKLIQIDAKTINDYKSVRLKNGTESQGQSVYGKFALSFSNATGTGILEKGKTYIISCKADNKFFEAYVDMTIIGTTRIEMNSRTNYEVAFSYTTTSVARNISFQFIEGNSCTITIYEKN